MVKIAGRADPSKARKKQRSDMSERAFRTKPKPFQSALVSVPESKRPQNPKPHDHFYYVAPLNRSNCCRWPTKRGPNGKWPFARDHRNSKSNGSTVSPVSLLVQPTTVRDGVKARRRNFPYGPHVGFCCSVLFCFVLCTTSNSDLVLVGPSSSTEPRLRLHCCGPSAPL